MYTISIEIDFLVCNLCTTTAAQTVSIERKRARGKERERERERENERMRKRGRNIMGGEEKRGGRNGKMKRVGEGLEEKES